MHELFLPLQFALKNLFGNLGRTLLTLFGIVIGTVAVLTIASAGDAVERYVMDQVESFGGNAIQIEVKVPSAAHISSENSGGIAKGIRITTLTKDDAEAIAKLPNVEAWYAGNIGQALSSYRETSKQIFFLGATAGAPKVDKNIVLTEGAFYTEEDDRGAAEVVVLGSNIRNAFFGSGPAVGKSIRIKGQSYRVVGVLEERGTAGFLNFDDFVYIPLETLQKKILGIHHATFITVTAKDEASVPGLAIDIDRLLRDRHDIRKVGEEDYSVMSVKETQELVASIFGAVRILLIALASISLVVGGIGIMNVLFVSVAERTSEIGLRKAVGARPKDILRQFLFESLLVALIGGAIGIALSIGILFGAFRMAASFGFPLDFVISLKNIGIALLFSLLTGVLFGVSPAWKASRIDPIKAIREG
ncbi:MAG: ABC transporter permease [Candidatus Moraniibacteriota bacterium]|nr:MAG: ABC transporter permease [Candidatus Moranbacteria bacterium]